MDEMDGCVDRGVEASWGHKKGVKRWHNDCQTTRYRGISTQNNDAELFFQSAALFLL